MRARLYRENHMTTDGGRRLVETGWAEEPLPLLVAPDPAGDGHDGATLIGTVTGVRREDGGWVTGELHTKQDLTGLACEADFDSVELIPATNGSSLVDMKGRLRAVTLGARPCWDGMTIYTQQREGADA